MCFVSVILSSSVFWVTRIFLDATYNITGSYDYAILVSLHTVAPILLIIEYPFNVIPWDWRFLPFDLIMMLIYLISTIIF